MQSKINIKRIILLDCFRAIKKTTILYVFITCVTGFLSVYTARVLGQFAQDVLEMNVSAGNTNAIFLLVCVMIAVVGIPLVEMAGRILMFRDALVHDRVVLNRFLDKEYRNIMKYEAGEVQHRLEWDPCQFRIHGVELLMNMVAVPVTATVLTFQIFAIDWRFIAVVFALSFVKLIIPFAVKKAESRYDQQTREYNTSVRAQEADIIEKAYSIKLFNLRFPLLRRIDDLYTDFYKTTYKKSVRCTTVANKVIAFLDGFLIVVILFVGSCMMSKEYVSAGDIVATIGYFGVINTMVDHIMQIIRTVPIFHNLMNRMEFFYTEFEPTSANNLPTSIRSINAVDLSFSYDDKPVFENLSFEIRAGDKVAICGENGSGKSTLAKLLCGLYSDYSGTLVFSNETTHSSTPSDWRHLFAYVSQDPYLFAGTVRDNIHLGNLSASKDRVDSIMEEIGIAHLADREVTMTQNELSGGEKQRISLARALLKGTDWLVLDETNNNLDRAGLEWLQSFISTSDKTIMYISHDSNFKQAATKQIIL